MTEIKSYQCGFKCKKCDNIPKTQRIKKIEREDKCSCSAAPFAGKSILCWQDDVSFTTSITTLLKK